MDEQSCTMQRKSESHTLLMDVSCLFLLFFMCRYRSCGFVQFEPRGPSLQLDEFLLHRPSPFLLLLTCRVYWYTGTGGNGMNRKTERHSEAPSSCVFVVARAAVQMPLFLSHTRPQPWGHTTQHPRTTPPIYTDCSVPMQRTPRPTRRTLLAFPVPTDKTSKT